ncbi:hypothetical protein LTR37_011274 [Vermiconidia calcicola]|uniref:Uncharacterized protein n=1 Tax=Vermiconidia calcicola TaxID=1690605 RepID=A0ACC3N2C2_9PEZI|nr:hypothetical protein LTR37_011274 [Vermiconidia calcicola]
MSNSAQCRQSGKSLIVCLPMKQGRRPSGGSTRVKQASEEVKQAPKEVKKRAKGKDYIQISSDSDEEPPTAPIALDYGDYGETTLAEKETYKEALKTASRALPPSLRLPDEVTWHGSSAFLGGGAGGQAFLWLGTDSHGTIVRRIVAKDCYVSAHQWKDVNHWYGDHRDVEGRQHMEIKIHEMLKEREKEAGNDYEYCAKMKAYKVFGDEEMRYRLYLAYYPHGDLGDVMRLYRPDDDELGEKPKNKRRKKDKEDLIPEPFLWSVLEALTEACLILEARSVSEPEDTAPARHETIVHRDIKPDNIYLSSPLPSTYPSYPHAILGDFGVAIITNDTDKMNPHAYNAMDGTFGWMPPEQVPMVDRATMRPKSVGKLSSKTNVWGIGAVIIGLMNREEELEGTSYKGGEEQPVLKPYARKQYSKELCRLLQSCTKYWPDERPDLTTLQKRIRKSTKPGAVTDLAKGMRSEEHEDDDSELMLKWHSDDPAAVGKFAEVALKAME